MCVPSVYHEGLGGSRWLMGLIPTWTTCSRHNASRLTGPNILLVKVASVVGTFRLLVPCMRRNNWSKDGTFASRTTNVLGSDNVKEDGAPVGTKSILEIGRCRSFSNIWGQPNPWPKFAFRRTKRQLLFRAQVLFGRVVMRGCTLN